MKLQDIMFLRHFEKSTSIKKLHYAKPFTDSEE